MEKFKRTVRYLANLWDLYIVDHGFLRTFYSNWFRLPGGLYRSNQPAPFGLRRRVRRYGLRQVVTLRGGEQPRGWYQLEKATLIREGVDFDWMKVYSRGLLGLDDFIHLKAQIDQLELPCLIHCKSGADRAGFVATLYRHYRLGEPIEQAMKEMSIRYGHFSSAKTGILDAFFLEYLSGRQRGEGLINWLARTDPIPGIERKFLSRLRFGWIVDYVLRRE